jgi:hypothetical protein
LHSRGKAVLAVLICAALISAPLYAGSEPASALGRILQAERARLGPSAAVSGATLFDGDRLETGAGGSLRAMLNSSQVFLLADSSASVRRSGDGASVALDRGTAKFSSGSPASFELIADSAQIRARAAKPTTGQVTLLAANEFVVSCEKGELEITVGDDMRTVAAGSSYRAVIGDLDQDSPQTPQGTSGRRHDTISPGNRKHLLVWILIGAAVGGTVYGVWRALHRVSDN